MVKANNQTYLSPIKTCFGYSRLVQILRMKKNIVFAILLIFLSVHSYSQIDFEEGYFINESNQKVNCLIKNKNWKNNPSKFEYKILNDDSIRYGDISTIKEFGVNGIFKYIKAKVNIDKSLGEVNNLSNKRSPNFNQELLFLKVLIEGKASLFVYENGNLKRFFYKTDNSAINQLIYKRYLIKENKIAENKMYQQQLLNDLNCNEITFSDVKYVNYNKRDLEKFFIKYNECSKTDYIHYELKQKVNLFNVSLKAGLNYSNLTFRNSAYNDLNIDFDNESSFSFGIEAEFVLPYNKSKWAVVIEPTFQSYKTKKSMQVNNDYFGEIFGSKVNYQSLELPIGVRYYFYLNESSKIFTNISYVLNFANNSSAQLLKKDGTSHNKLKINPRRNIALGVGYKHRDRLSMEMRYYSKHEILDEYTFWISKFQKLSIIFGYTLF